MNEMAQAFVGAFAEELEKLAVSATSVTKGSKVKRLWASLKGKPPKTVFEPGSTKYRAGTRAEEGLSQSKLRERFESLKRYGKAGRTTPGGAPVSSSKADMAAAERARAAQ